ncbi:ComF family protein [Maribacter sp. MJ134]|uniref:ComF family protein n=1 Tax=Maribacter sp. MJ134 TaxID=2496865 RepID=UPI001F49BF83|nr:phosphoribosyltransferase family protein [Maribacter sp. MJ134]
MAFHLNSTYLENVLIKTANTKTQTKRSRLARWYDNRSLYEVTDEKILKNKRILLVDDVITTGATMEICGRPLKKIEGTVVYIATMAVVE